MIVRELAGQELSYVIGGLETAEPYPYSNPRQCQTSDVVATLNVPRDGD
jgi:hypothetical protein